MPPVYTAFGMAVSYYAYPLLISLSSGLYFVLGALLLFVVIISFLRVLRFIPEKNLQIFGVFGAPGNITLNKLGIIAVAAAVGFSLGISARRTVTVQAEMGFRPETVIAISGILKEDPRVLYSSTGLGSVELLSCAAAGGLRSSARGNITVFFPAESMPRLKEFGRACEIYVDGKLIAGSGGKPPLFRATSVHIVKPAPALEQFRTGLRMALLEKFQSRQSGSYASAPVWGGLASALLLGFRDDLDMELNEAFKNSGCSHILALSGMHLAIISAVLAFFLRRPLGIRWASLVGAVFIVFYIFVAGSQASLVRSGIMYLIGTFAIWGLLKGKALSLLCMAFVIQLLFQSNSGTSLSFILSYLALAGILTLGESLRKLFRGRLPEIISGSFSASLGAFIFTAPVVAYYFGSLKPIGILAGLIIVPLSSLFMVIALAALAASFLPLPLWNLFDILLTGVYRLLEITVHMAGRFPGLTVPNPYPTLVISIIICVLILFVRRKDSFYRDRVASFD